MDYRPAFRIKPSSSDLTLRPSADASRLAQDHRRRGSAEAHPVKTPERVRDEAKAHIVQAGGDPECWQLVLSESELQFGQYWGQTFKWLLGHDVGYACSRIVSHQKGRDGGDTSDTPATKTPSPSSSRR